MVKRTLCGSPPYEPLKLRAGEAGELEAAQTEAPVEAAGSAGADQDGHTGAPNGHAQQLDPPQAEGHSGPGDEDPDELDLYGDMAGEAASTAIVVTGILVKDADNVAKQVQAAAEVRSTPVTLGRLHPTLLHLKVM